MEKLDFTINIKPKQRSQRAELIEELFCIYTSEKERNLRKKENWKRYIIFLKEKKLTNSLENQQLFKKTWYLRRSPNHFLKEMRIDSFCYLISHIPTDDLYHTASIARDLNNREKSFGAYLVSSITK